MNVGYSYPCVKKWNSPDSEINYKTLNSGKPNYSKDEINYSFNYLGFRSDEFNLESEFPILFLGCSLTEGEGLPLNEVWSYHLYSKICDIKGAKLPFWSLAKGGTSIDFAARNLYEHGLKLKPRYIFYLMSGISRREYCFESTFYQNWMPTYSKLYKPTESFQMMSRIFSDPEYALYQAKKSAMILDSVANLLGAKIFICDLNMDPVIPPSRKIELFDKFINIKYYSIPSNDWNLDNIYFDDIIIPDHLNARPAKARDNSHPGAVWQYKIYNWIWNQIENQINLG